ncbi:MAG: MBL fold metallo-hydrolase [Ruminococcaceae bacterium]|jgi:7,8-dihydropterin-6-yl-methyl-4-(beta-D-ribofuranosyl)aminobenzene 5'-phosphate synthase|nr:MBL fold metallo-hydrolase [Oscillospiraceae bacterium]
MDNLNSDHHSLHAEHGLSLWIQSGHTRILFDFGNNKKAFQNARMLSIDLSELDFSVCSHSHYDHSGGFPDFLDWVKVKSLITGPGFFEPKYSFDGTKYTYLGASFDLKFLQQHAISHRVCEGLYKLTDGCYAIGDFQKTYPMETIPQRFVRQTEQGFIRDYFEDEICLALETEKGIVVVVGCSHPGILNILRTVTQRLNQPVYAVIGGTHLVEADEERIQYTVSEMKRMGLKLLALSHCSGDLAERIIQADSDVVGCHLAVGESIVL